MSHGTTGVSSVWTDGAENDGLSNVGENATHSIIVKNEGTTTLSGFCIASTRFVGGCQDCQSPDSLAPGDTFICTLVYEVPNESRVIWYAAPNCLKQPMKYVKRVFQANLFPAFLTTYL